MGKHRQEFVLALVKFCQRFRLLVRLPLQAAAFSNRRVVNLRDVADELDLHLAPVFGLQRQILIAYIALLLQFSKSGFAFLNILEQTELPEFLANELRLRVAQQVRHERVGVDDFQSDH